MMRHLSPLRYPGGKAGLTGFLSNVIARNDLNSCTYYEPYAGGAGAALGLLRDGVVSDIYLNDADERINAFWRAVLFSHERFIDQIRSVPLTIEEWHRQSDICTHPSSNEAFEVGFAAFFMNRCNRSGVVAGAGPIGGWSQDGKWRLDARFNRDTLSERILYLARQKDRIRVECLDAVDFLKTKLPKGRGRDKVFVYLDPPYVKKGRKLYLNSYNNKSHSELAEYIHKQDKLFWIMSYDDSDLVRGLYEKHQIAILPIQYSLQEKRAARELIIAPHRLSLPGACRVHGKESVLQDAKLSQEIA